MTGFVWFIMILLLSPAPFPNIPFSVFNDFISNKFSENIPLSTVFLIFFTLIENTDLLNLHGRQKIKVVQGEKGRQATGWMKSLSRALYEQISKQGTEEMLFTSSELLQYTDQDKRITPLTITLDELAVALNLN